MARVRYLGPEPVTVPELGPERVVHPDEVVEVPDERYWGYVCQTANWEEIEPPVGFVAPGSEPDEPAEQAPPEQSAELTPREQPEEPAAKKAPAKKTAAKSAPQKED